ncbi:hypothetical protein CXG81DRAFT_26740 [Caulochytrium protostelioides]|uniref:SAGA-associated factor 11 n=1 Tax=Caulochytrium protostelioides TaxID=1555241 RepID=A0A4P9X5W5_9FUNG|nr:hypothetical protein CXG81DRAFT_26740 [Caulochytrium protostelioides]|eukprot:RKP00557.1 hypothetical protein CXG81DRAFT_26740 [Caulochytrium protostelioides]
MAVAGQDRSREQAALYRNLLAECVMDIALEFHRIARLQAAPTCQACHQPCRHYVVSPPRDLYGHRHPKDGPQRFACHACHHTFPAQRYAPHLEKCLGLGRASGARPTKRAAAVAAVTGIISIGQAHGHGASSAATHGSGAGSAGHGSAGAAYSPSLGAAHLSPYVDSFDSDSDTPQEKKRRRKKMKPARPTP